MCLLIKEKFNKPIEEMECYKVLTYRGLYKGQELWSPPYYGKSFTIDNVEHGWFTARDKEKEKKYIMNSKKRDRISRGCIHSFRSMRAVDYYWGRNQVHKIGTTHRYTYERYMFKAIARNVYAIGEDGDLISEFLYIPYFDKGTK